MKKERELLVKTFNEIDFLEVRLKDLEKNIKEDEDKLDLFSQTHNLFLQTLAYSRNSFKSYLENIVNTFIKQIYPDQKELFTISFSEKRNQIETEFFLGDLQIKQPFIGTGGGKLTIISLSLFLALNLIFSKTDLIMLDEVTKMIDNVALERLSSVLKDFCKKYNKNILIVTHQEPVLYFADNKYEVTKIGGISKVVQQ